MPIDLPPTVRAAAARRLRARASSAAVQQRRSASQALAPRACSTARPSRSSTASRGSPRASPRRRRRSCRVVTDERQYFAGLCGVAAAVGRRAPDAAVALLLPARRGQRGAARHRGRARGPGAVLEPRDPRPRRHRLRRLSDLAPAGHVLGSLCAIDATPRVLAARRTSRRSPTSPRSSAASSSAATSCGAWRSTPAPTRSPAWPTAAPGTTQLPSALRSAERLGHPLSRRAHRHRLLQGLQRPARPSRPATPRCARSAARWRAHDARHRPARADRRRGVRARAAGLRRAEARVVVERLRADMPAGPDRLGRRRPPGRAPLTAEQLVAEPTARCTAPSATAATASARRRAGGPRLSRRGAALSPRRRRSDAVGDAAARRRAACPCPSRAGR